MKKVFLGFVFLLAALVSVDAKVEPASLFADNMVLQQQTDAAIWGKARSAAKVVGSSLNLVHSSSPCRTCSMS